MYGEYCNTWNYNRNFNIVHFGNPETEFTEVPEPEQGPKGSSGASDVNKPKRKPRFLRQPKGWFRT